MNLAAAFALGMLAWWALLALARSVTFGGRIGSQARQRWLSRMDYEALLRVRQQIDDEIARRQP